MKNLTICLTAAYRYLLMAALIVCFTHCQDFIEVGPPKTEITSDVVFSHDASAIAAVRGIYSRMMYNQSFTRGELERYTGMYSDELVNYSSNAERQQFATSSLLSTNQIVRNIFWGEAYAYINNANAILEATEKAKGLSPSVSDQLRGEAHFVRAFCHFYLLNLFGDVPYVTSTDYNVNTALKRMPILELYQHVVDDLIRAKELMREDYSFSTSFRSHPDKETVSSLLARVYLYLGEWSLAEEESSHLIDNDEYELVDLERVFLADSKETIWQLRPVIPGLSAPLGQLFVLTGRPNSSSGGVSLAPEFLSSFEDNDARWDEWVGRVEDGGQEYYFAYKYKEAYSDAPTECSVVFRLAEQYLIRAEARAQQDNIEGAAQDINTVRHRAGLPDTNALDKTSILDAIQQERRHELFTEGGHRWLDLKRTGTATVVLSAVKPNWQETSLLFPIPNAELLINTNLSQNEGY